MAPNHIFISHSSKDAKFVRELREALEGLGLSVWVDSRELRGGEKLKPEIVEAIEQARQFIAVISLHTVNAPWVLKEIRNALEVESQRKDEGYRVIPLLLPGIEVAALGLFFDEEPFGIRVEVKTGGLSEALPQILASLGESLPDERQPMVDVAPQFVEELVLRLNDLRIEMADGKRSVRAVAQLVYEPADSTARAVESRRYVFTSPHGLIEAEMLRWYLEDYFVWPVGIYRERAERVEKLLPTWGQELYQAAIGNQAAQEAHTAWQEGEDSSERRFTVFIERELAEGSSEEEQIVASQAAAELLSLPWELLHDGRGFLFHGARPVRVRRRLPNRHQQGVRPTQLPIRILLTSPRPEDKNTDYIDHRVSAKPLVETVERLGELAKLTVLSPPTFSALEEALRRAREAGEPYDVMHFDGHGVYDPKVGLGALCFEDPKDTQKLVGRAMHLVHAERLAEVIHAYRIPLVFLEACQSAKTEDDPTASVAAKLLEEGVTSVVAMSHSILVETARRFVGSFYRELTQGKRIGTAMLAGQRELHHDTYRGKMLDVGDLRLQDWFVPVLYQEEQDPQLVTKVPPAEVQLLQLKQRQLNLGELPASPSHDFHGRSRELLALERLLHIEPWAVIWGQGGEGKTTLAIELARWLVRVGQFNRAAFISLEQYTDARGILDSLGHQLLPKGEEWSIAHYGNDLHLALQPIERALKDRATIIVLDNVESVLPTNTEQLSLEAASADEIFELCHKLLAANNATRLVITTRTPLPAPFNANRNQIVIGPLDRNNAVKLVAEVMRQEGLTPKQDDMGGEAQEVAELVEAVGCHARALVLLASEVARKGVRATTEHLHRLMTELHEKFPGDRENSLYASVELSLRRVPSTIREQVKALAVANGGIHIDVLKQLLGLDTKAAFRLLGQLIEAGLAQYIDYGHYRIDSALPSYLSREMSDIEHEKLMSSWVKVMKEFIAVLYEQLFRDGKIASHLTLLELPNLTELLFYIKEHAAPEIVVEVANSIELLLSQLGQPKALAQATSVREYAAKKLTEWSFAMYLAESAHVDRLLERRETQAAVQAAQELLRRCTDAGESAYPQARYDIAAAYYRLGRSLFWMGDSESALSQLEIARYRFQELFDTGNFKAERMLAVTAATVGDCLRQLGRLEKAAEVYQEAISRANNYKDKRQSATTTCNLGIVRMEQGRYSEALGIFNEVLPMFESLNEPLSVANVLQFIGETYEKANQIEQAENALRRALVIQVQQKSLEGEAGSMIQLGIMYDRIGRLEEAVNCSEKAAEIYVKLRNQIAEGAVRNNLGITFIKLRRFDEARRELLRAIQCGEPYGHSARLWNPLGHLCTVETKLGNLQAAAQAHQQAIQSYMSYRLDGGETLASGASFCTHTAELITQKNTSDLEQEFTVRLNEDRQIHPAERVLLLKLLEVIRGNRNADLAKDLNLDPKDAVELLFILKALEIK